MAVKTSWSSGDVLTAADLTDTFAAKMGPIASDTASVATYQSTTSSTYADLATVGPAVTVTTGTKALIIITAGVSNGSAGYGSSMSFAVSGSTTLAASDSWMLKEYGSSGAIYSRAVLVTGLTAGSNTFTAKYKVYNAGSTAYFDSRSIAVIDMGS